MSVTLRATSRAGGFSMVPCTIPPDLPPEYIEPIESTHTMTRDTERFDTAATDQDRLPLAPVRRYRPAGKRLRCTVMRSHEAPGEHSPTTPAPGTAASTKKTWTLAAMPPPATRGH